MIWDRIIGFELGTIFLENGFVFIIFLGVVSSYFAGDLRARIGFLNKLRAILFGGRAARLIIDWGRL